MIMDIRSVAWVMMFVLLEASALAGTPVTTDLIRQRGLVSMGDPARLQAVLAKFRRGEAVTLAAIGGSITAGGLQTKDPANRYIRRMADWFTREYPNTEVRFVNAGIGGSNSNYGAMRLRMDVLDHKPDLVVVEYAVNDLPGRLFAESYEGVLRQILNEPQKTAVIELFFMHNKGENAQEWQEMLGRHYNVPMVSFRDAWWPEFTDARAVWADLYADEVHPNDTGHLLASDLLIALLEQVKRAMPVDAALPPVSAELPSPMISDVYADCLFVRHGDMKPVANRGWNHTPDGRQWESDSLDGFIEFEFSGRVLFLGFDMDKAVESCVTFSIDGNKQQTLKADTHRRPLASDLVPGKHRVRIKMSGNNAVVGDVGKVRIWGIGGAGR